MTVWHRPLPFLGDHTTDLETALLGAIIVALAAALAHYIIKED